MTITDGIAGHFLILALFVALYQSWKAALELEPQAVSAAGTQRRFNLVDHLVGVGSKRWPYRYTYYALPLAHGKIKLMEV